MAVSRLCSIPECGKPVKARDWCGTHLQRWYAYGDPVAGGTFYGEPLRYLNEVVFAYDGEDCLIWPYARGKWGTGSIGSKRVPRLVCEHAYGPPPTPKHEAAHSCGKGHEGCCAKRHLSWKTPVQNAADKVAHGTSNRGERSNWSKLTEAQVLAIRAMGGKASNGSIGRQFGIARETVRNILDRKSWAHLD